MRRLLWAVLVLSACAPTLEGPLGEGDLASLLPGAGVYRDRTGLPMVSQAFLASPDARVREEAFARLRREKMAADAASGAGPEFMYLYGVYYAASGDYRTAAVYFDLGLKRLYPYAFDRQGRDIWEYGYRRALAYLEYEPQKALRDARILVAKAPPPREREMSKRLLALELEIRSLLALGDYEGALAATDGYFKVWNEEAFRAPYPQSQYALWRVMLLKGKALEGLGRKGEARQVYTTILEARAKFNPVEDEVFREAEARLNTLGQ